MSSKKKKKRMSKAKKWAIIFAVELILILILIPAVYVWSKLQSINTATTEDVNKADIVINADSSTLETLKGYTNIALFGIDSRDGTLKSGSRSDSIMIVSINHDTQEIKICSVYRDTCLYVPEKGFTKATHAYAYGGAERAMSMLNINFDLDITEFATVDFGVLANIIDAIGGIEITVTDEELEKLNECVDEQNNVTGSDSDYVTSSGTQTLNGTQATAYARIRSTSGGDFTRAERQRTVLSKIFEKAKSSNIPTLLSLIDTLLPEIYTNLSTTDIIALAKNVFSYKITDQVGFPFEKATGDYQNDGYSYVFAAPFSSNETGDNYDYYLKYSGYSGGLEQNTRALHEFLFSNESYTPSSTVLEYSNDLLINAGY